MQEATAEALAPEVVPQTETKTDEPDLGALYDSLTNDQTPEAEDAPEEAVEQPQEGAEATEEVEAESKPVEAEKPSRAPSELPVEVQKAWNDLSEDVRESIVSSHRDLNRKLSEQGRQMHGIRPIQESLVRAVKELPHLADMKPDQVADQVFELAKVSAQFAENPVQALMGYIEKHGLREQMAQTLAGEQIQGGETINNLRNHVAKLERTIQQLQDPEYIRSHVSEATMEASTMNEIQAFAQSAEHWAEVEDHLPQFVALERELQPDGSNADILKAAYEAAVSRFVPEANRASQEAAQAVQVDPEKTKAARKAKSVNVRSQPSNKTRTLSEDEELAAVWDRAQD